MYDQGQINYINGTKVVAVDNQTAASISYFNWENNMDWSNMGV
jgi:hypothetical protein